MALSIINIFSPHAINHVHCRLTKEYRLPPAMVASYGGSYLVKKCAEMAFAKHRRSMLAGDMVREIPSAFQTYFEPQEP